MWNLTLPREPITIIEMDMDYCSLSFGTSPCNAVLSAANPSKCFNTFPTCGDKVNFNKSTITYRFVQSRSNYPIGSTTFPCLVSTSSRSAQANIAGSDDSLYALGKRGVLTAKMVDFPYHDRFMDKYQLDRVSGDAQLDAVGYDPKDHGSFWQKFKARNPNYAGRPMREIVGYLDGGVLTVTTTRHFIITEIDGPSSGDGVTITGKDVLKLADDDRAVAPSQARGRLTVDINENSLATFTLNPAVGDEYPTSGFAAIGSELVSFTRSGDDITLTARGLSGTSASSHSVDDTFQQSFSPRLQRIDSVIYDLLMVAGIDPAFIPISDWNLECDRWATSLKLTTDIMKPTGVAELIGELAVLGITIWWDDVDQQIKLLVNHPVDTAVIKNITDENNVISTKQVDNDKNRLTDILFSTVQINPANGVSASNFKRSTVIIDGEAKLPESYGDSRIKEIYCRWLNHGDDASVRILSKRLLNRFVNQPVRYTVEVDYRDDVHIADVVNLTTETIPSATGLLGSDLTQVITRKDIENGHSLSMTLQSFPFDNRYAYFTENTRPYYNGSNDEQKNRGAYFCDPSLIFSDGTGAYGFS